MLIYIIWYSGQATHKRSIVPKEEHVVDSLAGELCYLLSADSDAKDFENFLLTCIFPRFYDMATEKNTKIFVLANCDYKEGYMNIIDILKRKFNFTVEETSPRDVPKLPDQSKYIKNSFDVTVTLDNNIHLIKETEMADFMEIKKSLESDMQYWCKRDNMIDGIVFSSSSGKIFASHGKGARGEIETVDIIEVMTSMLATDKKLRDLPFGKPKSKLIEMESGVLTIFHLDDIADGYSVVFFGLFVDGSDKETRTVEVTRHSNNVDRSVYRGAKAEAILPLLDTIHTFVSKI